MRPAALLVLLSAASAFADTPVRDETLRYVLNWPGGAPLGEAQLAVKANPGGAGGVFELVFDASLPGFPIKDLFRSAATGGLCSQTLEKTFQHGPKKGSEKTVFDAVTSTADRKTLPEGPEGGETKFETAACPHDALAFLQLIRSELAQARVPPPQTVYFGAAYQVRMEFRGPAAIVAGGEKMDADRVVVTTKGPASGLTFELFFTRDAAHTPVLARIPLELGIFTVERVR
jgi:hypothetical protein